MHTITRRPPRPHGQLHTQVTSWAGAARNRNRNNRNHCSLSLFLNNDGTAHVIGHANLTGSYSIEQADDRPHAVGLAALVQGF